MRRRTYWTILLNPVFLVLYGYGLSVVYAFCRYGNVARRLPLIIIIFLAGVLWIVLWTIIYFVLKKRREQRQTAGKGRWIYGILAAELAVLLFLTGCYGLKIYRAAQPYSGKLGTYISELDTKKSFSLDDSARDFLENGLDGILSSLAEHCGLDVDWELYTANTLTLSVDEAGTIQALEAFLYAFDQEDSFHSWLITYDFGKSEKMTVYLDGYADATYREQEQMAPLFIMIDALLRSDVKASLGLGGTETESGGGQTLVLKYSGYTSGTYWADDPETWYIVREGAGETEGEYLLGRYTPTELGVTDEGFLLNLYSDGSKLATIAMGIGSMETVSSIQEREAEEAKIENAKSQGNTLLSDDSGMTFYLDENTSMSLIVIDAALWSRFYAFRNGSIYNDDPFDGHSGVAESIYFLDETTGFILLAYASQDHSIMYYTQDGGETFTQVILPVDDGEEDMAGNKFGYTPEDMDYINTPYEEDGCLYVAVSTAYAEADYISMLFVSEDRGLTWRYLSYEDNF